jgi:hypothetical protein
MIIVSLTTIPPKFQHLYLTINSILSQSVMPDMIIIHIPKKYNNYNYEPHMLPSFSSDIVFINNDTEDFGPATKLLGLRNTDVYSKMSNDDMIIIIDDDRTYNKNLIKNMMYYHSVYPEKVLTVAGWDIEFLSNKKYTINNKKMPRGVEFRQCGYTDVLGGCCGFLLTKSMCPFNYHSEIFNLHPSQPYYYVDDVWISGFLTLSNIDIYIVPNAIFMDEMRNINDRICPLYDNTRSYKNTKCIEYFKEKYNIWN